MQHKPHIAFFGTSDFAVEVLKEMKKEGVLPALIVTFPDRRQGRGLLPLPSPVKAWATEEARQFIEPETIDAETLAVLEQYDLFVVAAYGKFLKKETLAIPKYGSLNVHPSLLPRHRGPSPVEGTILAGDAEAGVSIILLDEKMDHGPVIHEEKILLAGDEKAHDLKQRLARLGGNAIAKAIPDWVTGKIQAVPQDESKATYTSLIKKEDGEIDPLGDPVTNYRKFRAYYGWPGTYFFTERHGKRIRVIVKDASLSEGVFKIKRVLPEGGHEIPYGDFLRGL